jgi:hypothetical protein
MAGNTSRQNGKRGGRPRGRKNNKTLEREVIAEAFRQRVYAAMEELFGAQVTLARGCSFLFKRRRIKSKGGGTSERAELVTNPDEIQAYLNGELDPDYYYYITTKEPSNLAIADMLNRALGKPVEAVQMDVNVHGGELVARLLSGRQRVANAERGAE